MNNRDSKFDKQIAYAYVILLALAILLVVVEHVFAHSGVEYDTRTNIKQVELIPDKVEQMDEDTRVFHFSGIRAFGESDCLLFYTCHQEISVYQGARLLYQIKKGEGIFDRTTGAHWNFVQLEQKSNDIRIYVKALYPQMREYELTFYQGNAFNMFMDHVRDSFDSIFLSVLNMAVGIVLCAYWIVLRKRLKGGRGLLFFGIFSVLLGLWSLIETTIWQMVVANRPAVSDMGYLVIMMLINPFILFARDFLEVEKKKVSNAIGILSLINIVVITFLHISGIAEFKKSAFTTHILLVAGLMYMIAALVIRIRKVGMDSRTWVSIVGMTVLVVTCVLDLTAFYSKIGRANVISRLGFLLFTLLVGYQTARDTLKQLDQGYEAQLLVEIADRDNLTGLYNRNTYDKWVKEHPRPEGATILTFDLNHLKKCNDTLGHAMGDLYIKNAARIIDTVFGQKGISYRIGGDEFCTVVGFMMPPGEIGEKFKELESLESKYMPENSAIPLQIAHGYAYFDKYQDSDMEKTRERADKKMYENKKLRKEESQAVL